MRRLNTGFAVRFNLRHERVGYLFQNRFRSRLVAGDDGPSESRPLRSPEPAARGSGCEPRRTSSDYRWCGVRRALGASGCAPVRERRPAALALFADEQASPEPGFALRCGEATARKRACPRTARLPIAPTTRVLPSMQPTRRGPSRPGRDAHRRARADGFGVSVRELRARCTQRSRQPSPGADLPRRGVALAIADGRWWHASASASRRPRSHSVLERGAEIAPRGAVRYFIKFTTVPALVSDPVPASSGRLAQG